MSVLPHLAPLLFFAALLAFELARRRLPVPFRHPMSAYLARGAIAATYFGIVGIDPAVWLTTNVEPGVAAGVVLALLLASVRRAEASALAGAMPALLIQAAYLAIVVALVEEVVFRGAFVLVAAVTPTALALASVGSSIAYVVWRAVARRDRDPRSLGPAFVASVALGLVAGLTRSLWPGVIAHTAYVLIAAPGRSPSSGGDRHPLGR